MQKDFDRKENRWLADWNQWIEPPRDLIDPERRRQARLLTSILVFILSINILLFLVRLPVIGLQLNDENLSRLVIVAAMFVLVYLSRRGRVWLSCIMAVAVGSLILYGLALNEPSAQPSNVLDYMPLILLFGSLFLPLRYNFLILLIQLAGMLFIPSGLPRVSIQDIIAGPVSLHLTLGLIILLVAWHRNLLETSRIETLAISEAHLYTVVSNNTDGMIVIDQAGKIQFLNPAAIAILDRPPIELQGQPFALPLAASTELPIQQNDGSNRIVEMRVSKIRWNNAPATLASLHDITERKQTEQELQTSEAHLRTLFEAMTQGVVIHDAAGKIISANLAAERILGLTLEQMLGRASLDPHWHAIHPDGSDFSGETHPAMVALRTGKPVGDVIMGVLDPQTSQYVWINITAVPQFRPRETTPFQVYATFDDITTRKRNEDILRARLRLIEFAGSHTVKELLQATLDEASLLLDSPIGFYHFVDADQITLTLQAWSTRTREEFCVADGEDHHYPVSEAGVWADAARERRPLIHNNYAALENKHGMPEGHAVVVREMSIPILRGEKLVAIIGIGNKPTGYNATDLETFGALADLSWDIVQERRAILELRASEEQNRRLINRLPSGVVVHSQGKISFVNRTGMETFGAQQADQLVGTTLLDHVHPDFRDIVRERVRLSVEQGKEAEPLEEKLLRLDGSQFDAEVTSIPLNFSGRPSTLVVFNDITQRKQRDRELEAMAQISFALRTAQSRDEMLPIISNQIKSLVNATGIALLFIDERSQDYVREYCDGIWADSVGRHVPPDAGILKLVLAQGKTYLTNDLPRDPNFFHRDLIGDLCAVVEIPLIKENTIIGVITVGSPNSFKTDDVRVLEAISNIAANAIHRAALHEQAQKSASELALAYYTTLEGWAHALELRDQETEGHTRRVVDTTVKLARAVGIRDANLEHVRRGALLHDIGKMGIPDSILLKPSSLTEREWEIMRRHPEYAHKLLASIDYLQPAIDIPYCHHEKWDGTGYPRQLAGEAIPLAARIFAIVDVWDAIRSNRPYRLAWSKEQALNYIRGESGKHFDPRIVEAFLAISAELE